MAATVLSRTGRTSTGTEAGGVAKSIRRGRGRMEAAGGVGDGAEAPAVPLRRTAGAGDRAVTAVDTITEGPRAGAAAAAAGALDVVAAAAVPGTSSMSDAEAQAHDHDRLGLRSVRIRTRTRVIILKIISFNH